MQTIIDLIRARIQESPGETAYFSPASDGQWRSLNWKEYGRRLDDLAQALTNLGLSKGDAVCIIAKPSLHWELADKAILLSGGIVVGVEPHASPDHVSHVLQHAEIRGFIVEESALLKSLPPDLCKQFKFILVLQRGTAVANLERVHYWDELPIQESASLPFEGPALTGADPCLIVYTSGSTGDPKGICYTHAQATTACMAIRDILSRDVEPAGRMICWLPMASLFQRMFNLVGIAMGLRTYFVSDPRTIRDNVRAIEPAFFIAVPRFYEKIYQELQAAFLHLPRWKKRFMDAALRAHQPSAGHQPQTRDPFWLPLLSPLTNRLLLKKIRRGLFGSNLRFLITGSAPMPLHILKFFHALDLILLEGYGLSENIVPMAMNRLGEFRLGSVGKPLSLNHIRLASDGEIWVKGVGVFDGYHKEKPSERRDHEGFYGTGDFGRFDSDQFLFLLGRRSDLIKTSTGRRIAPVAIETLYRTSPYVDQVIVLGEGRSHLAALITIHREPILEALRQKGVAVDQRASLAELPATRELIQEEIARLNKRLAAHEQVRRFTLISEPFSAEKGDLTTSLKLRRRKIEERYQSEIEALYKESIGCPPP